MIFGEVFELFVASCPACVMYRALMEYMFAPAKIDGVFQRAAEKQYQRELLFSTLVDLISQVVTRSSKSVHAAYVKAWAQICVSVRALYGKLNHVEPGTSRALVQHTAKEARELIDPMKGGCTPLLKGYNIRILDGNHLGKTEHRLAVLRGTSAGALPGQSLVLLDPQRMIVVDIFPCEDAHAQERSLLEQILPTIRPRDLLIDDRNFCTLAFLFALMAPALCSSPDSTAGCLGNRWGKLATLVAWRRDGFTSRPSSCATRQPAKPSEWPGHREVELAHARRRYGDSFVDESASIARLGGEGSKAVPEAMDPGGRVQ